MNPLRLPLHWQILIALVAAAAAGWMSGTEGTLFGVRLYAVYDFLGTLFLNALKMIIVPLIFSSIVVGVAGIGGGRGLGRLGAKTVVYYLATSLFSILVGLVVVNAIAPGIIDGKPAIEVIGLSQEAAAEASQRVEGRSMGDLAGVFLSMFPPNIIAAAADGQMLGLIVFSLLFGFFVARITEDFAEAQYNFWQGLFEVMMRITDLVIRFTPIGVFGLVAKVVAGMKGPEFAELIGALALFALSVVLALGVHAFITLPVLLRLVGGVNPIRQYRAMAPALLTAFSTASSSGTLPLTMECVEKNAKVSNRTSSFVLPLGATVNMDGTALYECVAAIFIAQAYGLELSFAQQFTVVAVALLTSIGVAGIPSASLVAIAIILGTIGLPAEGIGLILVVDRILDMLRTSVNVFSDSCGAVIIGRSEGESEILKP